MPNLTDPSDVNELYITFLLSNETWQNQEIKEIFDKKIQIVGEEESALQIERARCMVNVFIGWAQTNQYVFPIVNVWWTGRHGALQSIIQKDMDYRKNPTDVLVQFSSGPCDGYLGMSAKSTRGGSDISFKNLGIGSVEQDLKVDINTSVNQVLIDTIRELSLPEAMEERKTYIRSNPPIRQLTRKVGSKILEMMRDQLFERLKQFDDEYLRQYILDTWLNASPDTYPPYVKVTGLGSKIGSIRAKVEHPLENEKVRCLTQGPLSIEKYGFASVGVSGSGKRIMKIRAKYSSEKLASSLKFMGDPW